MSNDSNKEIISKDDNVQDKKLPNITDKTPRQLVEETFIEMRLHKWEPIWFGYGCRTSWCLDVQYRWQRGPLFSRTVHIT